MTDFEQYCRYEVGEKGERTVTELIYCHELLPPAQQEEVKLLLYANEKRWNVEVGCVELLELVVLYGHHVMLRIKSRQSGAMLNNVIATLLQGIHKMMCSNGKILHFYEPFATVYANQIHNASVTMNTLGRRQRYTEEKKF